MASTTFSLSIPGWEQSQLVTLANDNELSGVNPLYIGLIDQAESGGNPGAPNSAGYGGYFGLSPTDQYPGGVVGSGEGENTLQEFDTEATIAGSEFASLLNQYGGNPVLAEEAYQSGTPSGPTEGSNLFSEALGLPDNPLATGQTGPTTATTPAGDNPNLPQTIQLKGIGAVLQSLDTLMNPGSGGTVANLLTMGGADLVSKVIGTVVRGMFTLGFVGVIYFGIKAVSSGGGGSAVSSGADRFVSQIQSQQRIGQQSRALDIAERRTGQSQQRIDVHRQQEARIRQGTKAKTINAKPISKTVKTGSEDAVKAALTTVGEASVL
jgi:hypothetical protein